MNQKIKNIVIIVALLVVVFVGYSFFFKKDSDGGVLTSQSAGSSNTAGGVVEEFLILLRTLNNLQLDTSIFNHDVYGALRDESVELVGQPRGRTNPFAPL
ncbi:MAG: hypothetical protein HYT27_01465 [Parcubacteria group bacterium]|nr:hypothetical protein [Parcubacteria group bacterium]